MATQILLTSIYYANTLLCSHFCDSHVYEVPYYVQTFDACKYHIIQHFQDSIDMTCLRYYRLIQATFNLRVLYVWCIKVTPIDIIYSTIVHITNESIIVDSPNEAMTTSYTNSAAATTYDNCHYYLQAS